MILNGREYAPGEVIDKAGLPVARLRKLYDSRWIMPVINTDVPAVPVAPKPQPVQPDILPDESSDELIAAMVSPKPDALDTEPLKPDTPPRRRR